jgi:hypothetical protein
MNQWSEWQRETASQHYVAHGFHYRLRNTREETVRSHPNNPRTGSQNVERYNCIWTSQKAVKILARVLLVIGIASMLFALGSCVHYYASSPPPEASLPGWNPESDTSPYVRAIVFWVALGVGFCTFRLGQFLHGRAPHKRQQR